jgi:hypothetical protein
MLVTENNPSLVVNRSVDLLHPKARAQFAGLAQDLVLAHQAGTSKFLFKIYEGFRHPSRQVHLIAKGATKAGPWQSAHQFGLAADFVPVEPGSNWMWTWDVPTAQWDLLHEMAARRGLAAPISWDKPHIQHPLWNKIRGYLV